MRRAAIAIVLILLASMAFAQPAERSATPWRAAGEPIEIDAKSMELRGAERLVLFEGSVVAVRGDLTLFADKVELRTSTSGQQIETIEAAGNVRIRKGDMVASGEVAHYDVTASVITLTGKPTVWRGRDAVEGSRIVFHIEDERVQVEDARAILNTDQERNEAEPPGTGEGQ